MEALQLRLEIVRGRQAHCLACRVEKRMVLRVVIRILDQDVEHHPTEHLATVIDWRR